MSPHGLRMWFEELVYLDSFNDLYKSILIGKDGSLFSQKRKNGLNVRFKQHIQQAYIEWKNRVAEAALFDPTDTKKS